MCLCVLKSDRTCRHEIVIADCEIYFTFNLRDVRRRLNCNAAQASRTAR